MKTINVSEVWWDDERPDNREPTDEQIEDDNIDKALFAKSLQNYVANFNRLPHIGMVISNGRCDPAKITFVGYNGVDHSISVELVFNV